MNTFKPEVEKTELEKRREELLKKHLWKSYSAKSNKTLYRCINIVNREISDGNNEFVLEFETLYIESGNTRVLYQMATTTLDWFKATMKPIKDKEFEDLRDKARIIISNGVLGG